MELNYNILDEAATLVHPKIKWLPSSLIRECTVVILQKLGKYWRVYIILIFEFQLSIVQVLFHLWILKWNCFSSDRE